MSTPRSDPSSSGAPRVRFAPSPTGRLHVGGARTALFNWAFARRHGGAFVLRVEDTDPERSRPEHEREILEGLAWLGLDWDEGPDRGGPYGPYRQSERLTRHLELAGALLERGRAYRCFCSAERLAELREAQIGRKETPAYDRRCRDLAPEDAARRAGGEPFVVRFAVPEGETRFADGIRGDVTFRHAEVDDWIVLRSDGKPTYNFVVVCDDADMRITHVLRGEEHLVNTPKQILLYRALDLAEPEFAHLPLMLGTDGKKLSKRVGDVALLDYRDKGYPPEAVLNFLCLQGWALDGSTEVFSAEELVRHFEIGQVSKGGAVFDPEKFLWLAGEYVRADDVERVAERCFPFVEAAGLMSAEHRRARPEWYVDVVRGEQERIRTYAELPPRIAHYFAPDDEVPYEDDALANARKHPAGAETLGAYRVWLAERLVPDARPEELAAASKAWVVERGLKIPALFQPLRCALTGQKGGRDVFEVMALLGRDRTLARLRRGEERLAS